MHGSCKISDVCGFIGQIIIMFNQQTDNEYEKERKSDSDPLFLRDVRAYGHHHPESFAFVFAGVQQQP